MNFNTNKEKGNTSLGIAWRIRYDYQDIFRAGVIVASYSTIDGWEHVSMDIDFPTERIPNFQEMSLLKDIFWNEQEVTMQVFPAEQDYVNCHAYTLHLWRNTKFSLNEASIIQEIRRSKAEATEYMNENCGVCILPGAEKKVAINGKKSWPSWELLHQIKKEFWGNNSSALLLTLGQKEDLNSEHCIIMFDSKRFILPPKEQV